MHGPRRGKGQVTSLKDLKVIAPGSGAGEIRRGGTGTAVPLERNLSTVDAPQQWLHFAQFQLTCGQLWSENIKWKILEINNS